MKNCIFCQIVAGNSPAFKVYEDENFLGFLDIYPRFKGHTLVIPKKHYQWVYDVPQFDQFWQAVLKITKAINKSLNPVFVSYLTYGLEVPHAHIHIIPHYGQKNEEILPAAKHFSSGKMKEIMEKIKKGFSLI